MSEAPTWFRNAVETPAESSTVEVRGCPIHTLRWGERGRPGLVFVHGGAAHAHWWSFLAPKLGDSWDVVALDLSGHGDSGRRSSYPRNAWVDEVLAVVAAAKFPGPPILVGHSMGGFVCIGAAAAHGESLAGAVIVDSPVRRPDPESDVAARTRVFKNPKTYATREEAVARFRLIPEQPCRNDWIVRHVAEHSLRQTDAGWTWKFDPRVFEPTAPRTIHQILPRVRCRIAMLYGEHSQAVTPDVADYMSELLDRNAPFVEIPEAHHHLILDQPLAFLAALRALLADWEHSLPKKDLAGGASSRDRGSRLPPG